MRKKVEEAYVHVCINNIKSKVCINFNKILIISNNYCYIVKISLERRFKFAIISFATDKGPNLIITLMIMVKTII